MLGILLNALIPAKKVTDDLTTIYNLKQNIFGTAQYADDYVLSRSCTIRDVVRGADGMAATNTYEFNNFTVPEGVILKPAHYTHGRGGWSGEFSPLILKCKGTLTVNGGIISGGTGGMTERFDSNVTYNDNQITTGIALANEQGKGWSCSTNNFFKLATYGANSSFFDGVTALYGAGGGGGHNYKRGRGHSRHKKLVHNFGFACGGSATSGYDDCVGSAGGFLALYFRHLIINGKEYGKDPGCDITRISANGVQESRPISSGQWLGGGCMIIAADTIVLGPEGTINSNALSASGVGSYRYAILNNPPQMCSDQSGHYMNAAGELVAGTPPNDTYYYSTGYVDENGVPEIKSAPGNRTFWSGGAGVALGFKIND